MRMVNPSDVLFELVEIAVRTEDRTGRLVVWLIQTVGKSNARLSVICRRKKRRTPDVSDGGIRRHVRGKHAGVMHSCIPLVIEEQHSETRIDGGLIRIREGSLNLIQTEAGHERRLLRNLVVHADGELVGPRYDFRRGRVGPIAKGSVRLVR